LKSKFPDLTNLTTAIWMHDAPDPDAIGSALGLAWIIKKLTGVKCEIFHGGPISHPENKSLVNVLSLAFKGPEEYDESLYDIVCTVDGTPAVIKEAQVNPNVIIDHHRVKIEESKDLFCLNKQVGACSSLIFELIQSEGLGLEADDYTEATALLFGIITDTNNLLTDTAVDLDFQAFSYYRERADTQTIQDVKTYPIPAYMFEYEGAVASEENTLEESGTLTTFLGSLSKQKRDVLAHLADRMQRKEGVDTTIIMAIVGDRLEASVRSSKVSLEVDSFVKKIFGGEHAGGKRGIGGASVPLGIFKLPSSDEELKEQIITLTKKIIMTKIKKEINQDA